MTSLRTSETEKKYKELIAAGHLNHGCVLCRIPALQNFTFWKIIPNEFPYGRIAKVHHMIVPIRHTDEKDLTSEESKEFFEIKGSFLNNQYDFLMEATLKQKTIPAHFHVHLITIKELID